MRKMGLVCMISLCMVISGLLAEQLSLESYWEYCEQYDKKEFESLQAKYKDTARLREYFEKGLLRVSVKDSDMVAFKRIFGVSDKAIQSVLMDIIHRTAVTTEWEWGKSHEDTYDINGILFQSIRWLGFCADTKTKQFLMGIATDSEKPFEFRTLAVQAYARRMDAQDMNEAIPRLLADDMRVTGKGGFAVANCVYSYALQAYDEAEGDKPKREAIIASLTAALTKEKDKEAFTQGDKLLAERSKAYADSPQRKAALERLNIPTEKGEQ